MPRHFTATVIVAAALVSGACASAPEPNAPADIAAINALREGFVTAFNNSDAEALGNLYTADAVSQRNHAATIKGREAIVASQKELNSQFNVKATITPEETRSVGDVGWDRGRYTMTMQPKVGDLPTMTEEGRYLVLVQKQADGTWKVTADIDNSTSPLPMAPPPPPAEPPAIGKS